MDGKYRAESRTGNFVVIRRIRRFEKRKRFRGGERRRNKVGQEESRGVRKDGTGWDGWDGDGEREMGTGVRM